MPTLGPCFLIPALRRAAALVALILVAGPVIDVHANAAPEEQVDPGKKDVTLPENVAEAVRAHVARKANVPAAEVKIVSATKRTWPNGALGLARPGEISTQALVPGWLVAASHGDRKYTFRTNSSGSQVREEAKKD